MDPQGQITLSWSKFGKHFDGFLVLNPKKHPKISIYGSRGHFSKKFLPESDSQ